MKKETRGRKPNIHKPIKKSFTKVLEALADSEYRDEKNLRDRKKK